MTTYKIILLDDLTDYMSDNTLGLEYNNDNTEDLTQ